jgi:putative membrane protein
MMYSRGIFHNNFWMHGLWFSGWNWLIGIGVLLLVVAVTYLIVKRNRKTETNSDALEILKLKYAKGEITEEEYISRKNVLENK